MLTIVRDPIIKSEINVKPVVKRPKKFAVVLLNDDITPMDFVVYVISEYFGKSHDEAIELMLASHNRGKTAVDLFTYEIAEEKVRQIREQAIVNGFPLMATIEEHLE